ncbi:hypothetical protein [Nocardia cyriacigeorgica]|uniref:Lipoprotein n=1 Tax=Nocardia cyriacigeorgica TaxID=135487 RepID=A0A5R8NAZ4_9NOCA|nr:hypothetical protein [Nocardia cyriacigeorgica]TLF72885.1 hypothetical protein FEK34_28085 [Nocardia cyriacigeorgica]
MFKLKRTALIVAAGVAVLSLTACDPSQLEPRPTPAPRVVDATETPWVAPTSVLPVRADPYSSDGAWLIGSEIAPGNYRVVPTSEFGGGWTLCATYGCGPLDPGFIANDFLTGPGYVTIPADALLIELTNVRLEAVA